MYVDPKAVGRNLAVVAKNGQKVADVSGPQVSRFRSAINPKLDQQRVMHGAHDQFSGFRGGATVFFPDGKSRLLSTAEDVKKFYDSIGRQTRRGSYNPGAGSKKMPADELSQRGEVMAQPHPVQQLVHSSFGLKFGSRDEFISIGVYFRLSA